MIFQSMLPSPKRPALDVCSHIFESRRNYAPDRVLYKTDRNSETLTLAQLEQRCRKLAWTLVNRFGTKRGETVAVLARDSVRHPEFAAKILYVWLFFYNERSYLKKSCDGLPARFPHVLFNSTVRRTSTKCKMYDVAHVTPDLFSTQGLICYF